MRETEFYVGYFPQAGALLTRFLRQRILALILLSAGLAVGAALWSPRLGNGRFEYGSVRRFDGRVIETPYPVLAVPLHARGGAAWSYHLLVGTGKHGAASIVRGWDGKDVHLAGTLIERDQARGIEVVGPPVGGADQSGALDPLESLGELTLTGEIVDGKCHLGVMTPGEGVTHRGCAVQCIRGGAPPLLVARDSTGRDWRFLLTDRAGRAVGDQILDLVARPVRLHGLASRRGALLYLAVEPATIERLR